MYSVLPLVLRQDLTEDDNLQRFSVRIKCNLWGLVPVAQDCGVTGCDTEGVHVTRQCQDLIVLGIL